MAATVWPPPPVTFSCCPPYPPLCPPPCPPPCPPQQCYYLPISTGDIGLSKTTGIVEQYGHNYRGTGIGLFHGYCTHWKGGIPYWGAGSWGCGPSFSNALAAVLTGRCA